MTNQLHTAGMLAFAGALYFVLNTALVSGMIALIEEEQFGPVWRRLAKYSIGFYLLGGLVASAVIVAEHLWGWQVALLIVPSLYLTYRVYRLT